MNSPIFDAVVILAEQLSDEEQRALVARLLEKRPNPNDLSYEEWEAIFDSMIMPGAPGPDWSDRREDWYGDDGR